MTDKQFDDIKQRQEVLGWLSGLAAGGNYHAISCIKKYITDLEQKVETLEKEKLSTTLHIA